MWHSLWMKATRKWNWKWQQQEAKEVAFNISDIETSYIYYIYVCTYIYPLYSRTAKTCSSAINYKWASKRRNFWLCPIASWQPLPAPLPFATFSRRSNKRMTSLSFTLSALVCVCVWNQQQHCLTRYYIRRKIHELYIVQTYLCLCIS